MYICQEDSPTYQEAVDIPDMRYDYYTTLSVQPTDKLEVSLIPRHRPRMMLVLS